jgi:hypothetical protein
MASATDRTWRRMGPGGLPGLQNRVGGRKVAGGFDSLPPPPFVSRSMGRSLQDLSTKSRPTRGLFDGQRYSRVDHFGAGPLVVVPERGQARRYGSRQADGHGEAKQEITSAESLGRNGDVSGVRARSMAAEQAPSDVFTAGYTWSCPWPRRCSSPVRCG